jgi:hypothetical protein
MPRLGPHPPAHRDVASTEEETMEYLIQLMNSGGELDRRTCKTEAEIKDAVLDLVTELDHFTSGDSIVITERE